MQKELAGTVAVMTWIRAGNLRLFLERVSARVGCLNDEWDWDAIRFGVRDVALEAGGSYAYKLTGNPAVTLIFSRSGRTEQLPIAIETSEAAAVVVESIDAPDLDAAVRRQSVRKPGAHFTGWTGDPGGIEVRMRSEADVDVRRRNRLPPVKQAGPGLICPLSPDGLTR